MGKTADNHFSSSKLFFILSLLSGAVFVPSLIFNRFGLSPFLVTISILCLSTIFIFLFSKKTSNEAENPTQYEDSSSSPKKLLGEKEVEQRVDQEMEAVTLSNAAQNAAQQSKVSDIHEYQVESTDCPSASESSDDFSATESFELNWMSFNNAGKNVAVSECSVSSNDEEDEDDNLIEISFPDNNSVELNEESEEKSQIGLPFNEESEEKMQIDLPEYLPESIFRQGGLMDLLKEINAVNEEENLIEIDLSMGSIKG